MLLKFGILSIIVLTSQIIQSIANTSECNAFASVQVCLENKNIEVLISPDDLTCQASEVLKQKVRDDYTYTPGIGYHKFHTQAKTWNGARRVCYEEGGHLAIVNSNKEEEVLRNMLKNNLNNIVNARTTNQAFVGAHDQFEEGDWVTVLGEPLSSTGFVHWSNTCFGPQPDGGREQNCGALFHSCPGMDDTWCDKPLSFFCELSDVC